MESLAKRDTMVAQEEAEQNTGMRRQENAGLEDLVNLFHEQSGRNIFGTFYTTFMDTSSPNIPLGMIHLAKTLH